MSHLKTKIRNTYYSQRKLFRKTIYGNCAVLLYHRVTDLKTDPQLLAVNPTNFDNHISLLKKKYTLLHVDQFYDLLSKQKKFPKNSILITFDDGYADNYIEALPVLEKYNAQALFYISTGTLNTTNEYWWDAMERIILLSDVNFVADNFELNGLQFELADLNSVKKNSLYESILPILRNMPSSNREEKIAILSHLFNSVKGRETHRAMTFDELKRMSESRSAIIGAHTHLHPSLASLTYEQQLDEIQLSKSILEKIINKPVKHFSYPFGKISDFNLETIAICKKTGFDMVAANYPELVDKKSNLYSFPRFLVRDWSIERFEKELDNFFN